MKPLDRPLVLSALPATSGQKRLMVGFIIGSAALCAALLPFAKVRLDEAPSFIPAYQAALIVCDLVTAVLILGQLRAVPSRGLVILASGYLFTALMALMHLLSFPGAFAPTGLLGGGPQTTAYLFVLWHSGFPLFVVAYSLSRDRVIAPIGGQAIVPWMILAAALAAGCVLLTTIGSGLLPPILAGSTYSTAFSVGRHGQWVITLAAILFLGLRRPHSLLDLCLIATLFIWWFEIALVAIFNAGRWDVGFYAGRIYSLIGGTLVLIVLLVEQSGVYAGLLRAFNEARDAERLKESEQRFKTVADSAPVLMWMNNDSGCVFVNKAYVEFVGVPSDVDVRGYDWAQFIHPDDRHQYLAEYTKAYQARAEFHAELRFRRRDGEYRWMRSIGVPRVTDGGTLLGYTGCTFDIHEQRDAAEALRRADRQKDEFIATLAHELRNPLAPLTNGLALLERVGGAGADETAVRAMMDRQLRHLKRLVDDLLEVSRITRGKIALDREPVVLQTLLLEAVESVRPAAEKLRHALEVDLAQAPLHCQADRTRIAQVFVNLLNNAVKFTPPGGLIRIEARRNGADALVTVRDNGVGLAAEHLDSIFEMFSQPVPAIQRTESGLGIGLALVKGLVELHGGRVEARSAGRDQGSEFSVMLPLALPSIQAMERPAAPAQGGAGPRRRVLIVDDNIDAAASLRMILAHAGHEVREAHDGEEGVRAAREFAPEVVILDLGMPRMNGYDAARAIRAEARAPVRIIALSGWGQEADRRRALEAGFDMHLTKPVQPDIIDQLLQA